MFHHDQRGGGGRLFSGSSLTIEAGTPPSDTGRIRDLGDGLILKRSRLADRERIADFHANTLLSPDETPRWG